MTKVDEYIEQKQLDSMQEIAKRMLLCGVTEEKVSEYTALPIENVKEISNATKLI